MKFIFSIVALITVQLCIAQQIEFIEIETNDDWNKALKRSTSEKKLLFLDAYADWCTYCHQLDKEVYTNPQVADFFNNNFVNVKFDTESELGMEMASRFKVASLPTLLFMNAKQEPFETIQGFVPALGLMAYAERAQNDFKLLPVLLQKYKALLATDDEKLELIRILETKDYEQAAQIAKGYINLLASSDYIENLENIWLVSRFDNGLRSSAYLTISNNKDQIIEAHGLEEYRDYFKAIYNDNLELAIKYGDENLLYQIVREVVPKFLDAPQVAEAAYVTKKIYFAQREDFTNYQLTINSFLNNQVPIDGKVEFLFSVGLETIEAFQTPEMLQYAADLLTQATTLDTTHFESAALLGYSKGLLGDYDWAIAQIEKSKLLAKDEEQKDMAESLIMALKQMKGSKN